MHDKKKANKFIELIHKHINQSTVVSVQPRIGRNGKKRPLCWSNIS